MRQQALQGSSCEALGLATYGGFIEQIHDLNMNLRTHKLHTVIPVPPASAREAESFDRTWVSVVEETGFRL